MRACITPRADAGFTVCGRTLANRSGVAFGPAQGPGQSLVRKLMTCVARQSQLRRAVPTPVVWPKTGPEYCANMRSEWGVVLVHVRESAVAQGLLVNGCTIVGFEPSILAEVGCR